MLNLSPQKQELLAARGNLLVMGGPGSGKTTIALLKAKNVIETEGIKNGQFVLFLSFARATIARVEQQAGLLIPKSILKHLEINTYHGFTWEILKSHGYLLNSKPLRLLPPPEAAAKLADFSESTARETEIYRLFVDEGLLHFDLFAELCAKLLFKSNSLARIISDAYPVIILDEFQDTNAEEWALISVLGKRSRLIALADPEQRIYEFRGADPARIAEFIREFGPKEFDFGAENNRSKDTDITIFGNDLLTGKNKSKTYHNVRVVPYLFLAGAQKHLKLKTVVLEVRNRLIELGQENWSLAVLVPSNALMIEVSEYLGESQVFSRTRLPAIDHEVALETTGPSLAAVLIARLLDYGSAKEVKPNQLLNDLCEHIRGRKNPPSKADLRFSTALAEYLQAGKIRGPKRQLVIKECEEIAAKCAELRFTGDPWDDWLIVRRILAMSTSEYFKQVEYDAKYLRLLHKGALLSSRLSNLWSNFEKYTGGAEAVRDALLQEHFASSTKVWRGVNVMTIHKAKGKEFDEVMIYEGLFSGRIVRGDSDREINQARLNLRVAVTRARLNTTILTPSGDRCCLL